MKKTIYFLFTKTVGLYVNLLSFIAPNKATKLAYALFSEPRDGRLTNESLPKSLLKTEKETHIHDDVQFQTYTWKGNDTVILLVHGWESNASRWKELLPYLQKSGSTIIAIDAPAHGLSSGKEFNIPQYAAYIDVLAKKFNPSYLIGHSLGGKTCLYYQSHYQNDLISKMVILGAPSDFKIILNNYIKMLSLNSIIARGLEAHYINNFNLTLDQFSGKHFASNIKTKGLVAHDIDDTVVSFTEGKKIAESWKNAVFIETNGLGHSMHSKDLYEQVCQFLFQSHH
ncbi:MAG: alpha/beta hydrolase [Flavobacteriaceae bacterium]|jgi:pimeloyl-ACP methyl ester carboxylesterase|uniref:Alpha/beta hydrolase n=1 Tax=Flavobacterium kayseriense TaxID=2764714 RepID=A0ABR7J739_9FLAO|nr:alpha/beta hydrolase [Flavobacterium kayseriense]MBC5841354.1 alpha/beta hydrolase [Flavobacterium kayseriense]MBC5847882.1 alpha/beta hydrolase [Flavobacterium kayseriense]MBU0940848.1 alpha/beta hydrolase [Bacteroidota bacterium]MBX9887400.1 alpha/beta hydrolase [Flavobacteriaceae bacterium]